MGNEQNTKVAISISTMNRPDFLARTLNYYAKCKSPHPVYLSDSSSPENVKIIKSILKKLDNKLEIHYNWLPPGLEPHERTLSVVKEKYALINGDDDYEIPSTLTKCAEFLENNPDYTAAGGHGISFRLKTSGPYGEIKRLADYPFYPIEANTASQRLNDFLKKCFVVTSGVNRVEHLKKIWVIPLPIINTWSELFQISHCAVSGKIKLLDCMGIVRHIHDQQYYLTSMVDWLTEKEFYNYYTIFQDHLAKTIAKIDNVSIDQAKQTVKNAFWEYLQVYMANEKKGLGANNEELKTSSPTLKTLRVTLGKTFPVLKTAYRQYLRPFISDKQQMHYDAMNSRSPYFKEFQFVMDSFTGKDIKTHDQQQ